MRYPVDNFKTEWNTTAGYGFGAKTSYGFHEGVDINKNGGGNIELGEPIYIIQKGKLVYYHKASHPTLNFGYHNVYKIEGEFGTRWVHQAHCLEDITSGVQELSEGQQVGRIGNSGTTYAHIHFAIFKVDPATLPQGIDTIAKTEQQLNDWWEDPIAFIEKWSANESSNLQAELDKTRLERDRNWNYFVALCQALGVAENVDVAKAEIVKLIALEDALRDNEIKLKDANVKIEDLDSKLKDVESQNEALVEDNKKLKEDVQIQSKTINDQGNTISQLRDDLQSLKDSATYTVFTGWKRTVLNVLAKL